MKVKRCRLCLCLFDSADIPRHIETRHPIAWAAYMIELANVLSESPEN